MGLIQENYVKATNNRIPQRVWLECRHLWNECWKMDTDEEGHCLTKRGTEDTREWPISGFYTEEGFTNITKMLSRFFTVECYWRRKVLSHTRNHINQELWGWLAYQLCISLLSFGCPKAFNCCHGLPGSRQQDKWIKPSPFQLLLPLAGSSQFLKEMRFVASHQA